MCSLLVCALKYRHSRCAAHHCTPHHCPPPPSDTRRRPVDRPLTRRLVVSMTHTSHHPRVRAVRAALQQSRTRTAATANDARLTDDSGAGAVAAAVAAVSSIAASAATPASSSSLPLNASTYGASHGEHTNGSGARAPWRRILYEPQPYPDSHTDESFLSQLVTNANVRPLSYASLCIDACAITQRLAMLALFLIVFYAQLQLLVSARSVLQLDGACLVVGMAAVLVMQRAHGEHTSEPWMGQLGQTEPAQVARPGASRPSECEAS